MLNTIDAVINYYQENLAWSMASSVAIQKLEDNTVHISCNGRTDCLTLPVDPQVFAEILVELES